MTVTEERGNGLRLLGAITAGVAHDLSNVLNGMFLRVQLLERAVPEVPAETAATLRQLRNDVLVGVELLDRVRSLARRDGAPTPVDLNDVLVEASDLARLARVKPGTPTPQVRREPGVVSPVSGRRGEIVSAVLNLLLNALDATSCSGHVVVRTGSASSGVWIEVEDDGPGIPADVERRMFEPFFTTKGEEGTGLGLASVAACMQRHEGTVRVDTAPARGTRVTLLFPELA